MMYRIGVLVLAAGIAAAGLAVPAAAQMPCRQFQFTTTRVTNPIHVTPLDAIAFPTTLTPQPSSTVVRQAIVCPPGTMLPPGFVTRHGFFGGGVIGAPGFVGAPSYYPYEYPYNTGVPVGEAPSYGPSPHQESQHPPITGTIPTDTVPELAANGHAYDRALVTVTGTAASVEETFDSGGRAITAFRLEAQGAAVNVVVWGHVGVSTGEQVRVSGPFYVSSPFSGPGGRPYHNVIEAETLER
jgi:hypothetical protein